MLTAHAEQCLSETATCKYAIVLRRGQPWACCARKRWRGHERVDLRAGFVVEQERGNTGVVGIIGEGCHWFVGLHRARYLSDCIASRASAPAQRYSRTMTAVEAKKTRRRGATILILESKSLGPDKAEKLPSPL